MAAADGVTLTGRVTDGQGAAVAAADVRVRRDDGTVSRRTTTDAAGAYTMPDLPAGDYCLKGPEPVTAIPPAV